MSTNDGFNLAAEDPAQREVAGEIARFLVRLTRPTFAGTPPLRRLDDANRLSSKVAVGEA